MFRQNMMIVDGNSRRTATLACALLALALLNGCAVVKVREQRAGDVRDVRDRGVDQRQLHRSTPFVLGTSLPITVFASRSATANALKIASAA